MRSRVTLALLLCLPLTACDGGDGDPSLTQWPSVNIVLAEKVSDCPTDIDCAVATAHNYVSDPATLDATIRAVATAGCQRIATDCAYICRNIFAVCAPTVAQCVDNETKSRLEGFAHPFIDTYLAQVCLDEMEEAACTSLPPDSDACDLALVEGCPDDLDNLGAPYSWVAAARLSAFPTNLSVHICDDVPEWLTLDLKKGDIVEFQAAEEEPSFGSFRVKLHIEDIAGEEPNRLDTEHMRWKGEEPAAFKPVDRDGTYYIELDANNMTVDVTLAVEVKQETPTAATP